MTQEACRSLDCCTLHDPVGIRKELQDLLKEPQPLSCTGNVLRCTAKASPPSPRNFAKRQVQLWDAAQCFHCRQDQAKAELLCHCCA